MIRIRIFKGFLVLVLFSMAPLFFLFHWMSVITEITYDMQYAENVSSSYDNLSKSWKDKFLSIYENHLSKVITLPSGYVPPCAIWGKDALYAINRTKSEYCKKAISELYCRSFEAYKGSETLAPSNLTNLCPTTRELHPELSGQYLGMLYRIKMLMFELVQ